MKRYKARQKQDDKSSAPMSIGNKSLESNESLEQLDIDSFTNITSIDDLEFTFNSSDVTVVENLELPLTVPAKCGGRLTYKFRY